MADNLRALFQLDPQVCFLNHGSYGACPLAVFETYQGWQARLERQPVAFMNPRHLATLFAEVRAALGGALGADPGDLVAVTNATAGLNIVARSLPLEPGDEILTTDHEYAALDKTWAFVARRTGAVIRTVTVPLPLTSEEAFTETLLAAITPRTKVLFLSHITSPTALLFPIERAITAARARGIWTVVDGAHAPGQIPLNLNALGADFYAGNCHKWMMAPKGSAFLFARPEMQGLLEPALISHGWTEEGTTPGPFGGSAYQDAFQFQGTRDHAAFLSIPAALEFARVQGWQGVADRCRIMAQETAERLRGLIGLPALSSPEFCAPQMVSVRLPDGTANLRDAFLERYGIEIPFPIWRGQSHLRLSVQGYNVQAEMDQLQAAVRAELQPGGLLATPSNGPLRQG